MNETLHSTLLRLVVEREQDPELLRAIAASLLGGHPSPYGGGDMAPGELAGAAAAGSVAAGEPSVAAAGAAAAAGGNGPSQELRMTIASQLHDRLTQPLCAAMILLGSLREEARSSETQRTLGAIEDLIQEAIDEARSFAHQVYPVALVEGGLHVALERYCQELRSRFPVSVDLIQRYPTSALDLATQDTLFATVRELLTNVVRHAGADHVQVCIERAPAGLRATVADDGRGMPHHRLEEVVSGKRGFGLYSAQRRVASLGGTLRLSTPENGGLRAEIHLPVPGGEAPGHDEPEDPSHDH